VRATIAMVAAVPPPIAKAPFHNHGNFSFPFFHPGDTSRVVQTSFLSPPFLFCYASFDLPHDSIYSSDKYSELVYGGFFWESFVWLSMHHSNDNFRNNYSIFKPNYFSFFLNNYLPPFVITNYLYFITISFLYSTYIFLNMCLFIFMKCILI
jgi:hypothetical protein